MTLNQATYSSTMDKPTSSLNVFRTLIDMAIPQHSCAGARRARIAGGPSKPQALAKSDPGLLGAGAMAARAPVNV